MFPLPFWWKKNFLKSWYWYLTPWNSLLTPCLPGALILWFRFFQGFHEGYSFSYTCTCQMSKLYYLEKKNTGKSRWKREPKKEWLAQQAVRMQVYSLLKCRIYHFNLQCSKTNSKAWNSSRFCTSGECCDNFKALDVHCTWLIHSAVSLFLNVFLSVWQVTIDHHPIRFFVHKRPHVDFFLECVSVQSVSYYQLLLSKPWPTVHETGPKQLTVIVITVVVIIIIRWFVIKIISNLVCVCVVV